MNIVSIVDVLYGKIKINNIVTVRGWVRTRRDSKIGISFLTIYDGSCFNLLQTVLHDSLPNYKEEILHLTTGCSVIITGKVVISPGKGQNYELQVINLNLIGKVDDPNTYPMTSKHHSFEYLREVSHLRPRSNLIGSISRIRHVVAQSIHRYYHENGFFWVPTPLITSFDSEGNGDMFRVSTLNLDKLPYTSKGDIDFSKDFFGKASFLTVSGQLNGEIYACALSKIYTFGPTFRAENSNTTRHLSEFWMIEPEVAFFTLDDIIILAENTLKYVFQVVLNECQDDMNFFIKNIDKNVINRLQQFISSNIKIIHYSDAINILLSSNVNFKNSVYWGVNLFSEHERFLVEKYFKVPIVIINYPKNIKAFYMRINNDKKTVASMDFLLPGIGEIIGGSQREDRLEVLDQRLLEVGLNKEDYKWYRDLRRYGTVPHSGFGLGFERLMIYITGMKNIRDIIPFPRTPNNINF
ncbi:Asparagine--tRNA ligase [Serratia symbiotica]|nr:Asparagine--tRNA ligase [Serratia symbiotica]